MSNAMFRQLIDLIYIICGCDRVHGKPAHFECVFET